MSKVDPITLSVINNYLISSATEMRDTIQNTSFSPVIYEDRDFACGIFDREGNTIAEAPGLTMFMGALGPAIKKSLDYIKIENIKKGDVFCSTLPEYTGSHPNDMLIFAPIFFNEKLFGFTASKAHLVDLGAKDMFPIDSTDAYLEGLRVPPTRLYISGELNVEVKNIILLNSRAPNLIWGDIQACISALARGESATIELLIKYGYELVNNTILELYNHAEKLAKEEIEKMPEGSWSGEDFFDNNAINLDETVKIKLKVTVNKNKKEIIFDYTGSAPQQKGSTNSLLITTISLSRIMGKLLTRPDIHANEGSFRPIKVIVPEKSVFNPSSTAPTSLYGWPGLSAMELFCKILAPVFPEKVPACSGGDLAAFMRFGIDEDSGMIQWFQGNIEGVGQGASINNDGENCVVHVLEACSRNLPVEIDETHSPILVEKYELITDSGGAGKNRGGLGVQRDYKYLTDGRALGAIERSVAVHWGANEGEPGSKNYAVIKSKSEDDLEVAKFPARDIKSGEVISIRTGGGGGYGNPLERDIISVQNDVIKGYVSYGKARDIYGVVIDPVSYKINKQATSELRNELK